VATTVADLLAIDELRLGLVAGKAGLDRPIRWAHVSELVDPTRFLRGGEVLLTTGLGMGGGPRAQAAYVGQLARAELAALGVGLGFAFEATPPAVLEAADRAGFPVFEVLRPIPPLAWVPASIIFWPTQELAIIFITFLGAFYTIVINVLGGARSIDVRYFQAAQSMGSSSWDIFRRVILPGTLPSSVVGSAVGMGITWEVVVAAEMISGGGSQQAGVGGGLGFFIWNSYVGGSYEQIVVGMISIGIAGFISSELLRWGGRYATPWLKAR